jgi:lysyl-tRNA synthetase class 2
MDKESKLIQVRKEKIAQLKENNINLYPNDFKPSYSINELKIFIKDKPDLLGENGEQFSLAGRMMAINKMGKSSFVRFKQGSEQFQVYLQKDGIGNDKYALFKKLDIGDFIGVKGPVFKTRTGEWTLLCKEFKLLSKTIKPLPEKFHGIKDPEKRYRQRYLDLIMNPASRQIFVNDLKL